LHFSLAASAVALAKVDEIAVYVEVGGNVLDLKKMPAMKIAGLCLPLKPQKENLNDKYT
jgi:hypothetical protein